MKTTNKKVKQCSNKSLDQNCEAYVFVVNIVFVDGIWCKK